MEQNKVDCMQSFAEQKELHDRTINEIKSEAQKRLLNVKLDLEMQLSNQKVNLYVLVHAMLKKLMFQLRTDFLHNLAEI